MRRTFWVAYAALFCLGFAAAVGITPLLQLALWILLGLLLGGALTEEPER